MSGWGRVSLALTRDHLPVSSFLSFFCMFSHIKTFLQLYSFLSNTIIVAFFFEKNVFCQFWKPDGAFLLVFIWFCYPQREGMKSIGSPPSLLAKHENCIPQQYLAAQTDQGLWLSSIFLCNRSRGESWSQSAKYKYSVAEMYAYHSISVIMHLWAVQGICMVDPDIIHQVWLQSWAWITSRSVRPTLRVQWPGGLFHSFMSWQV